MKCILCDKEIVLGERTTILPFDRPIYYNLKIHYNCRKVTNIGNFIQENKEKLYNILVELTNEENTNGKRNADKRTIKKSAAIQKNVRRRV